MSIVARIDRTELNRLRSDSIKLSRIEESADSKSNENEVLLSEVRKWQRRAYLGPILLALAFVLAVQL